MRPHRPIPFLDPILLPIPGDATLDLEYLSQQLIKHLACEPGTNKPGGSFEQLAMYLDGFMLTGWDTKVHDVLRDGDVIE